jgi:hypothetical protein
MGWYLRSCLVCLGDLQDDPESSGWVICFMCARSFRKDELPTLSRDEAGVPGGGLLASRTLQRSSGSPQAA